MFRKYRLLTLISALPLIACSSVGSSDVIKTVFSCRTKSLVNQKPLNLVLHLTMNKDKTYGYYYENKNQGEEFKQEANGTWKRIAAFKFTYEYFHGDEAVTLVGKETAKIAFFKLGGLENDVGEQAYLTHGYATPQLIYTDETEG